MLKHIPALVIYVVNLLMYNVGSQNDVASGIWKNLWK